MSKYITCDNCEKQHPEGVTGSWIQLKGYNNTVSGILLPDHCRVKDFCTAKCFEEWLIKGDKIKWK